MMAFVCTGRSKGHTVPLSKICCLSSSIHRLQTMYPRDARPQHTLHFFNTLFPHNTQLHIATTTPNVVVVVSKILCDTTNNNNNNPRKQFHKRYHQQRTQQQQPLPPSNFNTPGNRTAPKLQGCCCLLERAGKRRRAQNNTPHTHTRGCGWIAVCLESVEIHLATV